MVKRSLRAACLLVLMGFAGPAAAQAQSAGKAVCSVVRSAVGETVLDCTPGYATAHDRILIYGKLPAEGTRPGSVVDLLPDLERGALVFDAGADESANLVVVFAKDAKGTATAKIYDDRNDDGRVSIRRAGPDTLDVVEAGPTVQFSSPGGWWQRNGIVNFNLDITTDGVRRATHDAPSWGEFTTDGSPEVAVHVRDEDADGRPDYEWRQIQLPVPESSAIYRTQVMVNVEDDEPPLAGWLLWPYVSDAAMRPNGFARSSYSASSAPLVVDWNKSQVTHLGEFVASRAGNSNYFIYSISRLDEGKVSKADFENPFAFYDLSGGLEAQPTLMIRNAYFPPDDGYLQGILGRNVAPSALDDVSYAWRFPSAEAAQASAPVWDYEIDVAGTHEYTSVVKIGDLSVVTMPYSVYPYWVTEQSWDMAAFVADEGAREQNTEGMSAWGALVERLNPDSYRYMAGQTDSLSFAKLETIARGYRGEVAPELGARPVVYISDVDRKLHLRGASFGVWNVDGTHELRYRDLDGDGYLDQWQHYRGAERLAELDIAGGLALLAQGDTTAFKPSPAPGVLFEGPPPRDHAEWLALKDRLNIDPAQPQPEMLQSIFSRLPGTETVLAGAPARDVRAAGASGVSFIVDLPEGFSSSEAAPWPPLAGTESGPYRVTFDGAWGLERLAAQALSLKLATAGPLVAGQPVLLAAEAENSGAQAAQNLALVLTAQSSGQPAELTRISLDIPSGEAARRTASWRPPFPGSWTLALRLEDREGNVVARAEQRVEALAAGGDQAGAGQSAADTMKSLLPAALGMLFLAASAGGIVWRAGQPTSDGAGS